MYMLLPTHWKHAYSKHAYSKTLLEYRYNIKQQAAKVLLITEQRPFVGD
jgi:hypothetical protein